jgi:hypothetical protein
MQGLFNDSGSRSNPAPDPAGIPIAVHPCDDGVASVTIAD